MTDRDLKELADRIAGLIRSGSGSGSEADLRSAIEDLGTRLSVIEEKLASPGPQAVRSSQHPSLEKYAIPEPRPSANGKEAICDFEPHGRPCDKCSMCSSRGF